MAVFIVDRLKSNPTDFHSGDPATLRLSLQADSAAEKATVEYRLNPNNDVVFAENGKKMIEATFDVSPMPTLAERRYALTSPPGKMVVITAIVLPDRDERSKETVTILS